MRSNFELSIVQIDGGAEREASHVPTQTLLSPSALKCGPKNGVACPPPWGVEYGERERWGPRQVVTCT